MGEQTSGRCTIAGFPIAAIVAAVLVTAAILWAVWATRTLVEVRDRRIVRVSLAAVMEDFVRREARAARPAEETAARTRAYLVAVDRALALEARDGAVVLVSEATLGGSVPDRTDALRRELTRSGRFDAQR